MRKLKAIVAIVAGVFMLSPVLSGFAQQQVQDSVIVPHPLQITCNKTTNLIFPFSIKSVDRGSREVLAQKALGVENVLQVKAGSRNFEETNLSVITGDGRFYSYLVNYSENPSVLNISYTAPESIRTKTVSRPTELNEAEVIRDADKVLYEPKTARKIAKTSAGMRLALDGIYIHENVMYFRIKIDNRTNINYDISQIRFFIRDQKKSKRTASQEIEVDPVHVKNEVLMIAGQAGETLVVAVPKFTIPEKKLMVIQLMEKAGGRHLEAKVRNRTLMKAQPIVWPYN